MNIEIIQVGSGKTVTTFTELSQASSILDIKKQIYKIKKHLYPSRQSLRLETKGKSLPDASVLKELNLRSGSQLYLKDLGPQIQWKNVFLAEYFGPLAMYLITYIRPTIFYGKEAASEPYHMVVNIAAICWTVHYGKRLLETLFVHRFSNATMPIKNLFKNCSYYWLFGLYIGYYVNHPLYTPPKFGSAQMLFGLIGFAFSEFGNFCIHWALRNLRPPGTRERRIPMPTSNPFTFLFSLVSCPNYTYEYFSWVFFTVMTQCLPAGLFTIAGGYQMTMWAIGKHRNYKKEFPNYPKKRKSIFPYLI